MQEKWGQDAVYVGARKYRIVSTHQCNIQFPISAFFDVLTEGKDKRTRYGSCGDICKGNSNLRSKPEKGHTAQIENSHSKKVNKGNQKKRRDAESVVRLLARINTTIRHSIIARIAMLSVIKMSPQILFNNASILHEKKKNVYRF